MPPAIVPRQTATIPPILTMPSPPLPVLIRAFTGQHLETMKYPPLPPTVPSPPLVPPPERAPHRFNVLRAGRLGGLR